MIKDYGLYYKYRNGDNLLILFSDVKILKKVSFEETSLLYSNDDTLIGLSISDFSKYIKIKGDEEVIYLPNSYFIDVINIFLKKYHLEELSYRNTSGFQVCSVISCEEKDEEYLLTLRGEKTYYVIYKGEIKEHKKVIFIKNGTFLKDKTMVRCCNGDGIICTYNTLYNDHNENIIYLENSIKEGTDLFSLEERIC